VTDTVRVGTRGSKLALAQTGQVVDALRKVSSNVEFAVETLTSAGDRNADAPLAALGRGAFTSTLEQALREGRIDLAVHSLKDLPADEQPGIMTVPVLERADPRDVLVNRWNATLMQLPAGARIGTSSPRRAAQLKLGRKDIEFLPIRGNVETRIAKATGDGYDGAVLAAAGLIRLGLQSHVAEYLSPLACPPDPGQGALAVQLRTNEERLFQIVRALIHRPTTSAVLAERWVLRAAGGGCAVPIGALATVDGDKVRLLAAITALDGSKTYRVEVTGPIADPDVIGKAAYQQLMAHGAAALLTGGASK